MARSDPHLWLFLPSHTESWLACMVSGILGKCQCVTSEGGSYLTVEFPLCILLDHSLWGKPPLSCPEDRTVRQPFGEVQESRNWSLLPTASINLEHWSEPSWKPILLTPVTSSDAQLTSCLQPHQRPWVWTTQLSHFCIVYYRNSVK